MKKTKVKQCQKDSNISTVKSSKLSFVFRPLSSILLVLRRLEFLGLYSYLKIQPSLGRRSSSFHSIKRLAKLRITGYSAVVALLFLSFATISPIYIEHTPVEAESGTATPSTLTFTSIKNSASVNLNVTSKDGTFATSTADEMAQFSISTNNYTGYTLKLRSIGSITTLNGDTTNINTISTTTTKTTFENTTSLNNHWGYIPSHYNSQANTSNSYYPAPTNTNAATIMVTNSANGSTTHPATSDTYTIGLGLRADYTNPSGTYTNNTFILEYVANEVTYSIVYDDGDISGVGRIPASIQGNINTIMTEQSQSGNTTTYTTNTNTIALTYSPAPERSGYNFVGWCYGTLNTDGTECNSTSATPGKLYKDGEGFGIDKTTSNIVTLYAVWESLGVTLTFDANGGSFAGGSTTNILKYSEPEVTSYAQDTKTTSTTTNADGSGALKSDINDDSQYASDADYYQDVTLNTNAPAPYNLTIYYATEDVSCDWICVFEGTSYTPDSSDDCTNAAARAPETNTGDTISGNEIGGPGSDETAYAATATYKLNSKTARIYFHSDGSVNSYGFWAEFTGGGDVVTQNLISGTYIDKPSDRSGYAFLGWATTPNATTPDYTYDVNAIVEENTTVYAVWGKNSTVTYSCNGGTGTISPQTKIHSTNLTLNNGSACSKSGYAIIGWDTNSSATSPTYTLGGTYSQEIDANLYAVWGKNSTVTYSCNGGTGTISPQTKIHSTNLTLNNGSACSKSGHVIIGWGTNSSATSPTYTLSGTYSQEIDANLYAVWVQGKSFNEAFEGAGKKKVTGTDYYAMQDMTSAICATVQPDSIGLSTQLIDTRDNKIYWVSKLKDGHCWMTQNLDLDLSSSKTLTPDDTSITANWTPASTATTVVKTALTSSTWATSSDHTHPYSFDGGNAYLPNGLLSSSCSSKDITTCSGVGTLDLTNSSAVKDNVNAHYHVGNLYTWTAAIAMNDSSSYSSSTSSDFTKSPQTSICPKGWRLPNGASNGDFKVLNDAYGSITSNDNTLRAAPLYFVRSGRVSTGSLSNVGSNGYYWSSTVYNSYNVYYLYFDSTRVYPTLTSRYFGVSVRCVAQ